MASACMGDIAILEVALRNHMDRQLSLISLEQSGTEDWYMAGLRFDDRTQRQIREAWGHLTIQQKKRHAHGHLVAALTFGFGTVAERLTACRIHRGRRAARRRIRLRPAALD